MNALNVGTPLNMQCVVEYITLRVLHLHVLTFHSTSFHSSSPAWKSYEPVMLALEEFKNMQQKYFDQNVIFDSVSVKLLAK